MDVRRQRAKRGGVRVRSERQYDAERRRSESCKNGVPNSRVSAIPGNGPHCGVDDRLAREALDPGWLIFIARPIERLKPNRMNDAERGDIWSLEARWTGVEVEIVEETPEGLRLQTPFTPEGS